MGPYQRANQASYLHTLRLALLGAARGFEISAGRVCGASVIRRYLIVEVWFRVAPRLPATLC